MKPKLTFLVALAASSSAHAAVIVQYDMETFTETGTSSTVTANTVDTNVLASTLDDDDASSSHAGEIGDIRTVSGSNWNTFSGRGMDGGEYLEFTITPGAGQTVDLDTLTLDSYAVMTLAGGTAGADYNIRWSGDGFASVVDTITGASASTAASPVTLTGLSADLSSITGQTSAFTIRLEVVNSGGINGVFTQRGAGIDNLTLNGTVTAVPEPFSAAFLGLGGLALILRRRK